MMLATHDGKQGASGNVGEQVCDDVRHGDDAQEYDEQCDVQEHDVHRDEQEHDVHRDELEHDAQEHCVQEHGVQENCVSVHDE